MEAVIRHQNGFARDLYAAVSDNGGNILMSPFSIGTALVMTYAGTAGNTALQMRKVMTLPEDASVVHDGYREMLWKIHDQDGITLQIANRLYVQEAFKIRDNYMGIVKAKYFSEVKSVDFRDACGTSGMINQEVEKLTRDKIKNAISPSSLSSSTKLIIVNVIYFKGTWQKQFEPSMVKEEHFHDFSGQKDVVTMMSMYRERFSAAELKDMGCKAIALPYKGGRFEMVILLPIEIHGLAGVEAKLRTTSVSEIRQKMSSRLCNVKLPKFKMEQSIELTAVLQQLGMQDLFDIRAADLSKMADDKDLHVSAVAHKAFIDVTESGTEAAAATSMMCADSCAPVPRESPLKVFCDHPFFFAIFDRDAGLVLFSGRLTKP